MTENEDRMQTPIAEPDASDKASLKHRKEEETLKSLGFKWFTDAQCWGSETNYELPLLRNFEARALANTINVRSSN